ncbi:MAG: response regulator [Candidatus Pacebacteria bacterium]|jgi:DNA-binding response OmpR family regulator|nr:response regulator [Candidatus Paceibacterota bacterium]MDD3072289.1 response regulator [Candidatus Paceibacterota bacterium]MDD3728874.1 response regulator [Candidatus Paceibacterota bacterium]MDD4201447.1 response regulator [Candidatus Paceibacterota bacterium]MDD4467211.1 response regulator [Candidatus Paceibacterota bacterium]
MKKLIVAIKNNIMRSAYCEIFEAAGFKVFQTNNGRDVLHLVEKEKPDIVLADIDTEEISGYDILKSIKNIPVIIFSSTERKDEKEKAIELNAKDFISMDRVTPNEVVSRVRIAMGEQKSYKLSLKEDLLGAKDLLKDFGYFQLSCRHCSTDLVLNLIKDLSVGENYYKASFFCPKCFKK